MTSNFSLAPAASVCALLLLVPGCSRDLGPLEPAPFPTDGVVFEDEFTGGVDFQAFSTSKVDALAIDRAERYRGVSSLRFTVPGPGDPSGGYAGGAFVSAIPRDLTGFNALTFRARASTSAIFNSAGFGNDNTGTSRYVAEVTGLPLSTTWTRYVIPIPLASRLDRERGLFFLADAPEHEVGYELWLDDIQFENLGTIINPRPAIATRTINGEVGGSLNVAGTEVTFDVGGRDVTVSAMPGYFTFQSSDPSVAAVTDEGAVALVGAGSATITASLGGTPANGTVTVNVASPPEGAPPVPDLPASNVISLFSDAYDDVPVDTWSAVWDQADVEDVVIAGNTLKQYSNLGFAGIEFTSRPIDASAMTHMHLDLWTSDASAFRVKLVDFGADGAFGGGDDSEHEITLDEGSMPAIGTGAWNVLDIPLPDFAGLSSTGHLAQLIISGASPTVYLDNILFYGSEPTGPTMPAEPAGPAPTPDRAGGDVVSLFSDAYDDVPVDTWSAEWDQADLEDVEIAGNAAKKYTNLAFAGIEFTSQTVDASAMGYFHMDVWTPDPTMDPAAFRVKLVDFGADGVWGGGDDVEHELSFDDMSSPALATGSWVGLDVPLSAFEGLTTRGHLAQMIISGDPNTVFVDNVYFYTASMAPPTEPAAPAPAPTLAAENVVSFFSNAYDDVTVDTWSAEWDQADVEDIRIGGDDVKKYTNLNFAGIEFTSATVDGSAMTHFHMDVWTPDPTVDPAAFRVKLVDFGADGAWGGGDDVEHELTFTQASDPALATGSWVSIEVPLSAFEALTSRGHLAQLIVSGDPNTVFLDNVYLHN